MKTIIAIDSFKGCLTSLEAGLAAKEALLECHPGADVAAIPVSDGGDGMLDAFTCAMNGTKTIVNVHDPLMRRIEAQYGTTPDGTAIVEVAQACGLTLLKPDELNPMAATTYGVGELIAHAVRSGCRNFIVGLGGSATSDAGIGMLKALVDILAKGKTIDDVVAGPMAGCRFTLASDVRNPLLGPEGAARVFAPQKGATPEVVERIENRAKRFARMSAMHFGYDRSNCPGAGAAGGLGYAFMQYFSAESVPGADLLFDKIGFDGLLEGANLVITGEGHADGQTLMGKLPQRILCRASKKGVPTWLIAGCVDDSAELLEAGFRKVECINPAGLRLADVLKPEVAKANIKKTIMSMIKQA